MRKVERRSGRCCDIVMDGNGLWLSALLLYTRMRDGSTGLISFERYIKVIVFLACVYIISGISSQLLPIHRPFFSPNEREAQRNGERCSIITNNLYFITRPSLELDPECDPTFPLVSQQRILEEPITISRYQSKGSKKRKLSLKMIPTRMSKKRRM